MNDIEMVHRDDVPRRQGRPRGSRWDPHINAALAHPGQAVVVACTTAPEAYSLRSTISRAVRSRGAPVKVMIRGRDLYLVALRKGMEGRPD